MKILTTPAKGIKWITAAVIFAVMLLYSGVMDVTGYPWDASYYWTTADPVVFEGGFHILNFPATFRGYLLPTLVTVAKYLMVMANHGMWGWRVLIALMVSVLFSFVFPTIFSRKEETAISFFRTLLSFAVFLLIWGYYAQFPLSDIPTAFFLCSAAALLMLLAREEGALWRLLIEGICCGWCLYAAYNTRVATLYGIVFLLAAGVIRGWKEKRRLLLTAAALLIGFFLAAIPQMMINYHHVGDASPKVHTDLNSGYDHDLITQQVFWGIEYPRYAAYIGEEPEIPYGAAYFNDPTGEEILSREGLTSEEFRISDFFHLLGKYPLDMIGIYARHLISVLTPTYTTEPYITEIRTEKGALVSFSILLWMLAALAVIYEVREKRLTLPKLLFFAGLCIPSLLQMAGAPETRFFLTIYLLAYYGVLAAIDYPRLWRETEGRRITTVISMAVVYILWIAIIGTLLASYQDATLLLHDRIHGV